MIKDEGDENEDEDEGDVRPNDEKLKLICYVSPVD
jgi:hypothetical protein